MTRIPLTTILCAFAISACSTVEPDGTVFLRGRIDPAMADKMERAVQAGHRDFIIESPGGYVMAAARMAKAVAVSGSKVTASGECRSACSFVLMAASERHVTPGTIVSLHNSAITPEYARALQVFGVPDDIIAASAHAVNDRPLSDRDLARMGVEVGHATHR